MTPETGRLRRLGRWNAVKAGMLVAVLASCSVAVSTSPFGPRPADLVRQMEPGPLRDKLASCLGQPLRRSAFSMGHRGAPMMYPEHSEEGNRAAAAMGAGSLDCDVVFTRDHELICRHAQDDLHMTTNILATPLAAKCSGRTDQGLTQCNAADISLAEFKTLKARMLGAFGKVTRLSDFLDKHSRWETYRASVDGGTVMSHADFIALTQELGLTYTPELKAPTVAMPHNGFTSDAYVQKLVNAYKTAGISARQVRIQTFDLSVIAYLNDHEPAFGAGAIYLDGRVIGALQDGPKLLPDRPETFRPTMQALADQGLRAIAPPIWALVTLDGEKIVPTPYAVAAKAAGLEIYTWTLERTYPMGLGSGWYFHTVIDGTWSEGDYFEVLDVLAKDVGISGIFSDWPATSTFYANCMGL
ncbi:MAG: glycerophosphodiester phosphodiesterase family protein [Maritimibacter sp.]